MQDLVRLHQVHVHRLHQVHVHRLHQVHVHLNPVVHLHLNPVVQLDHHHLVFQPVATVRVFLIIYELQL